MIILSNLVPISHDIFFLMESCPWCALQLLLYKLGQTLIFTLTLQFRVKDSERLGDITIWGIHLWGIDFYSLFFFMSVFLKCNLLWVILVWEYILVLTLAQLYWPKSANLKMNQIFTHFAIVNNKIHKRKGSSTAGKYGTVWRG